MSHGLCHTHTQSDTITNLNKTDPHKYLMNEPQQDPLELRTTLKFKLKKIKNIVNFGESIKISQDKDGYRRREVYLLDHARMHKCFLPLLLDIVHFLP